MACHDSVLDLMTLLRLCWLFDTVAAYTALISSAFIRGRRGHGAQAELVLVHRAHSAVGTQEDDSGRRFGG